MARRARDAGRVPADLGADRYALLLELSRAFGARLEHEALVRLVLERTTEALDAEGCSILLLDPGPGELTFVATSDPALGDGERLRGLRFPADRGIAGATLREGRARRVPDVAAEPSFNPAIDAQTGVRTRSLLCAPLRTQEGAIGVIEVVNRRGGEFSEDDLAFLDALSGSLAIALENARLYAAVRSRSARLEREVTALRRERPPRDRFAEIVGSSPAMERVFALMETAAESSITVLLQGETGVGKEVVARAIHRHGPRREAPFVTVNCGALPETLLESELFGYRRGAFTGAAEDRAGLFEAADGGTLFLDEIGDTTPATQVKLLRALQEGEVRRVGDTRARKVDVRVISATNRELDTGPGEARFRPDLYYRLSVFPIRVPPLRERREDVPALVSQFLERSCRRLGKPVAGIEPAALDRLAAYDWPGNVRELENEIERAVALAPKGGRISLACLSERVAAPRGAALARSAASGPLRTARLAFERDYVAAVLAQQEGNATRAARSLGISRQMMQRKIREYGLREG
jgi:Nif-specific regulatory protein